MDIQERKTDHVRLSVSGLVNYDKAAGFGRFDFVHNALPEVDFADVDTGANLLGRRFSFPLFISSMTGGTTESGAINEILAEFCEEFDLPMGVGSQRIMLEDPSLSRSFAVVREKAPHIFLASNIGGCQLIGGLPAKSLRLIVDTIRADAIIVHLNPLQELMQTEGDRSFKGILKGIEQLVRDSDRPVIVKETGAGISAGVAVRLVEAGVKVIDVAGAGGTSWAKVENKRKEEPNAGDAFGDWGIPTVDCLLQLRNDDNRSRYGLIASGGIRSSLDILKALCLGADFTGAAQPIVSAVVQNGEEGLRKLYSEWHIQLKTGLCLLGSKDTSSLNMNHLYRSGQ